jgi:hypothetical protein
MALSLKISAANLYILHSGSRDVPSLCAKRIVAMRPADSWRMESRSAEVGEAVASPTPTPRNFCKLEDCGGMILRKDTARRLALKMPLTVFLKDGEDIE